MGYRNYAVAVSHIVDSSGAGDFTTIGAALTAASSGQTIFIRPGTYTENPTLKAGVNLVAFTADEVTPNVIINGNCTLSTAGTVTISGVQFETNSLACVTVSGSAASILNLYDCSFNASNTTPISFTTSSSSAQLNWSRGTMSIGTTGITAWTHSSAGAMNIQEVNISNPGASTTQSTVSGGGSCNISLSSINVPISVTGSSTNIRPSYSQLDTSAQNVTPLTFNVSGTTFQAFYCKFVAGSATAVVITAGTGVIWDSFIQSSATNAISGAGTLQFKNLSFLNTAKIATTTQTELIGGTPCFLAVQTSTTTSVTGDGTNYTVLFNSEIYDSQSNYATGTGIFTAPVAGRYAFTAQVTVTGITSGMTAGILKLICTSSTYFGTRGSFASMQDNGNSVCATLSCVATMSAGDTAYVDLQVSNGSKVANVFGQAFASGATTAFSGYLIPYA